MLDFIRPAKPAENGFIQSFNGPLRDECLNVPEFATLAEASGVLRSWKHDYNHYRPPGSVNRLTPDGLGIKHHHHRPVALKLQL
jgi:putative transposase